MLQARWKMLRLRKRARWIDSGYNAMDFPAYEHNFITAGLNLNDVNRGTVPSP